MKQRTTLKKVGLIGALTTLGAFAAVGTVAVGSELIGGGSVSGPASATSLDLAVRIDPPATIPTTPTPSGPSTAGAAFAETFDGNAGLERFDRGVWHRDDEVIATTSWTGDHDTSCGSPATQRTIQRDRPDQAIYTCKDHMMTSIGDTSGYSIGWLATKQTFNGQTEVSVDVNSTNLGIRQWWEVALVPANYNSGVPGCEPCISGASAVSTQFPFQPDNTFVFGLDLGGNKLMVDNEKIDSLNKLCNDGNPIDPEGCASKPIRRTWTVVDNRNGTVTLSVLGQSATMPGSFPTGDWKLVIKDHNYTPNKSGPVVGHTWHWDNIIVR